MSVIIGLFIVIGMVLGLLGGGGSILTVPVLVYLVELPTKSAIVTSLIVVGITSTIAVISYTRRRLVCWKIGITFGIAGMVGAFIGGRISAYIPGPILLVLLATVMLLTSVAMIRNKTEQETEPSVKDNFCPFILPVSAILFDGILVGLVTGLIGVGGGFLLVPALTLLAGLPIQAAIGTSLLIIVLQSIAALAGHANHMVINPNLTGLAIACTISGCMIGNKLSKVINSDYLKRGFGFFVLFLGCFLLYQEMSVELIEQIKDLIIEHQEFIKGALTIIIVLMLYRLWSWLH